MNAIGLPNRPDQDFCDNGKAISKKDRMDEPAFDKQAPAWFLRKNDYSR